MSRRHLFTLIACALMLMGCAQPIVPSMDLPPIPANLAQPCEPLPLLPDGLSSTVLKNYAEIGRIHRVCAARVDGLIQAWPK